MFDEAFIRSSLDTQTYESQFLRHVQTELTYRGLTVRSFANHIFANEQQDRTIVSESHPLRHGLATITRIKDQRTLACANYTPLLDVDPAYQIAKPNQAPLTPEEDLG